jgi:anthranilate synthase component 1
VLDRYETARVSPDVAPDGTSLGLPRFFGGLVGAIAYDAVRAFEAVPDRHGQDRSEHPDLVFLETGVVLVWDNVKHRAMLIDVVAVAPDADDAALENAWDSANRALDEAEERLRGPLPALPANGDPEPGEVYTAIDDRTFAQMVERAKTYIAAGDIIQVVLSRRFLQARRGLHPFSVYRALRALNPSPYMFYLELGDRVLVGASPELLVRRTPARGERPARVEVRPIAGTRPRGADPTEDAALATELLADPKEIAEHVMLVDLGRNDVGRIATVGSVRVDARMVVERYSHVMHLVSHVSGEPRADTSPCDVFAATFPAGTLSGAPKIRAMEIIDELESSRRGFYGGAVGTVALDGSLDLAIAIRTLVADDATFAVQAGAGVVQDSVPESEAAETRAKAMAVLKAMDIARKTFHRRERS